MMRTASDKQDAKDADAADAVAYGKAMKAAAVPIKPVVKPIDIPVPTGALADDFPGRAVLADAGILTYKDLSRFAPDYRITGIDEATAKLITAELAKAPLTGVAARFCTTRDTVMDAAAVTVKDEPVGEHVDIYLADGQVFRRARETSDVPQQPGEFAFVT
jgi:hypothetical protein